VPPPGEAEPLLVFLPRGQIGDELETEGAARSEDTTNLRERRGKIALAQQRLQHSVRCHDHVEGRHCERQKADVAAHQLQSIAKLCAANPCVCAREHRRRSIDADEIDAGFGERQADATGTATELEDRSAHVHREIAPERHVASAEGSRVLPVVERRVLIPAFEPLRHRDDYAAF
jgi:hypothetical protein